MNLKVHYIGQYSEDLNKRNLMVFPSALTKMNYIISRLINIGFDVNVFSPAETKNNYLCHYYSCKIQIDKNFHIRYVDTIGSPNIIFKIISRFWIYVQFVHYLLFNVRRNEIVLVYHTWHYRWPIRFVKILKDINIFFEIEEIFNAVAKKSNKNILKEISYLKHNANGYIVVNDLMKENLKLTRPTIVCYGSYSLSMDEYSKFEDGFIHIVYAGLIEGEDSDVYLAMKTMRYLPNNYCLDILGYGTTNSIEKLINAIDKENLLLRQAINYHGCLSGREYYSFLAKSHIGLCSRILEDKYSDFAFPSKLLVYLGNNLVPVCTPIRSIINSRIKDYIFFSDDHTAESLAETILKVDVKYKFDLSHIIKKLDYEFCSKLQILFKTN
jgi:hypothetical protein